MDLLVPPAPTNHAHHHRAPYHMPPPCHCHTTPQVRGGLSVMSFQINTAMLSAGYGGGGGGSGGAGGSSGGGGGGGGSGGSGGSGGGSGGGAGRSGVKPGRLTNGELVSGNGAGSGGNGNGNGRSGGSGSGGGGGGIIGRAGRRANEWHTRVDFRLLLPLQGEPAQVFALWAKCTKDAATASGSGHQFFRHQVGGGFGGGSWV